MTLREEQEKVQRAMNAAFSGLREDPWLAQRVLANAKGEEPKMKKKLSVSVILVIVLVIVSMSAALAAELGLFGKLAQVFDPDGRLVVLDETADTVNSSFTTEDGITVEIGQAYYEGNRVFMSYRMSGNIASVELYEGAPEKDVPWSFVQENFVAKENMLSIHPELQKLINWLDGKGQRWGISREAMLHDGLSLEDGTYLDIIGGDSYVQEDGSIIGWKECEIPEDRIQDTLTFKTVLFRNMTLEFQDFSTLRWYSERGESTNIFFTLRRNDHFVYLSGSLETDTLAAQASFTAGKIDLKGTIKLNCPAVWGEAWMDWENELDVDMIGSWNLYQNGQLVSESGTESIHMPDTGTISFEQLYPHMANLDGLTLVPVYSQSGEHLEEAIPLALPVNQ